MNYNTDYNHHFDNILVEDEFTVWSGICDRKKSAYSALALLPFILLGAVAIPIAIVLLVIIILNGISGVFIHILFFAALVITFILKIPNGKEYYAITNKRAIVYFEKKNRYTSLYFDSIGDADMFEESNGYGIILFSTLNEYKAEINLNDASNSINTVNSLNGFYGIKDVKAVHEIFTKASIGEYKNPYDYSYDMPISEDEEKVNAETQRLSESDKTFESEILDNENVIWQGEGNAKFADTLEQKDKAITVLIFSLFLIALVLYYCVLRVNILNFFMFLIIGSVIATPLVLFTEIKRKEKYLLTDKRVIIYKKRRFMSYELKGIEFLKVRADKKEIGSVTFNHSEKRKRTGLYGIKYPAIVYNIILREIKKQ